VATAVGGFVHQIQDGETGLLVEPESVEQLQHAISRLLDDESLRRRIGINAHAYAKHELSWKHICRQIYTLYLTVVQVCLE